MTHPWLSRMTTSQKTNCVALPVCLLSLFHLCSLECVFQLYIVFAALNLKSHAPTHVKLKVLALLKVSMAKDLHLPRSMHVYRTHIYRTHIYRTHIYRTHIYLTHIYRTHMYRTHLYPIQCCMVLVQHAPF
jgi:hypothetical protein